MGSTSGEIANSFNGLPRASKILLHFPINLGFTTALLHSIFLFESPKFLQFNRKTNRMGFDEYEYLENSVENLENRSGLSKKNESGEKKEKGYRKREEQGQDNEEDERKRKRSRSEEANGERRREDRERSERRREKEERHRSERNGDREKDRDGRERSKERDRDRERRERDRDRERREREKEKEREREREGSRRSSSRSRRHDGRELERDRERELREREIETRESRRFKDKKETVEQEADPERDQRTVFAYQMPLKATERDVFEFFSKAGKVRDVRLIMDRNSRRSKGVGYVEFYDAMSVPMAIALSGQLLLGQPVMVKPSEAEKNLVQSTTAGGGLSGTGPYGPTDRKLYVGNLHFNMTEIQLRQIFESFGPVELVQLPLDPESGQCKGFGFVQFAQVEHAKAAQTLNGNLEIAGRVIKVSSVTEHVSGQEAGTNAADFDDDDGSGLALNARSRALLMQKLDRTGTASGIAGSLGMLNGAAAASVQPTVSMPLNWQAAIPAPALPGQVLPSLAAEPIGSPSECLLLKNLFDAATESDPEFDLDIKEDVGDECSKYGRVKHIFVDKNSAGHVYLRFENTEAAANAQRAMHMRWFARRLISAVFMPPHEYETKFGA